MSEDQDVVNPEHYNKCGIEVIDVIEAYELPYHLGNVVKYVLRHSYKGKPLQDLQKALWYLCRYVEDLEDLATIEERRGEPTVDWDDVKEALLDESWKPDPVLDAWYAAKDEPGEITQEVEEAFEDESWKDILAARELTQLDPPVDETLRDFTKEDLDTHYSLVDLGPDRIAGDNETARKLKDEYYKFDRYEILGWCASCDKELGVGYPYITAPKDFDEDVKFCSHTCVDSLLAWQGR